MKLVTLLLALSALGGCTNTFASARDDNGALFNSVEYGDFGNQPVGNWADATENRAEPVGPPPTRAFMVGRWGVGGSCDITITFKADGSASPMDGATWSIANDVVTLIQPGGEPSQARVTVTGPNTITLHPQGGPDASELTRCR